MTPPKTYKTNNINHETHRKQCAQTFGLLKIRKDKNIKPKPCRKKNKFTKKSYNVPSKPKTPKNPPPHLQLPHLWQKFRQLSDLKEPMGRSGEAVFLLREKAETSIVPSAVFLVLFKVVVLVFGFGFVWFSWVF